MLRTVCLMVALLLPLAVSADDFKPDPLAKGKLIEGLLLPSSWYEYWPTAKVGDFVVYKSKYGHRREEVMEIGKDYLVVARVVENRTQTSGRTELWTKFGVNPDLIRKELEARAKADAKRAASKEKAAASKSNSNSKSKGSSSSKTKGKTNSTKDNKPENDTEVIKVGEQEVVCKVERTGNIARWYSPLFPFSGIVKEDMPDSKEVAVSFGRGK